MEEGRNKSLTVKHFIFDASKCSSPSVSDPAYLRANYGPWAASKKLVRGSRPMQRRSDWVQMQRHPLIYAFPDTPGVARQTQLTLTLTLYIHSPQIRMLILLPTFSTQFAIGFQTLTYLQLLCPNFGTINNKIKPDGCTKTSIKLLKKELKQLKFLGRNNHHFDNQIRSVQRVQQLPTTANEYVLNNASHTRHMMGGHLFVLFEPGYCATRSQYQTTLTTRLLHYLYGAT
ncbi:hypothetical protein HELRODRAFT_182680 [Helobdella robusta]|uniref:Uncharacterized protein n=1 Tax=Helobdella robusta TaxID=6412 RepID=T1FIK5_HELRO|nr:hypothetical protein HELRODRAFT_182680 [Helobdella robusta]ESN90270.1 hypothetical protein HELRODRAFT_182680 [Helobdella robusta]